MNRNKTIILSVISWTMFIIAYIYYRNHFPERVGGSPLASVFYIFICALAMVTGMITNKLIKLFKKDKS